MLASIPLVSLMISEMARSVPYYSLIVPPPDCVSIHIKMDIPKYSEHK